MDGPGGGLFGDAGGATGSGRLNAVWNAIVYGVSSASKTYDVQRGVAGIQQAFAQSPYFRKCSSVP